MNKNWEKRTIQEICLLKSGNSSTNNSKSGTLPYVKVGDMTIPGNEIAITTSTTFVDYESNKKQIFPIGSVIFPKRGGAILTNKKRITTVEICCDLNIMGVIPGEKIFPNFLYYYFLGIDFSELCNGASIPQINNIDINPLEINLPPLEEQKRIVAVLDKKFAQIETLKTATEKNLQNTKQLFQAELEKAFSNTSWEKKRIDSISENHDSERVPITKNVRTAGKYPYYGASGIVDYVNDYIFEGKYLLVSEDGANLLARTYPIAFVAEGKFWVNNHAHILKFDNEETMRMVEYYFMQLDLSDYVTGMAQPKFNQASLNKLEIPFPPLEEQKRIVAHLDSLSEKVHQLEEIYTKQISDCEELKQSLLAKAFEGEL